MVIVFTVTSLRNRPQLQLLFLQDKGG